jgi:hypothetical protein
MYSLALIIFVASEKKPFEHFPIGSNVNLFDIKWKMATTAGISLTLDPINCPGMIIGRSSIKCWFFMTIRNPRWPPLQEID